jgi:hypothetical protein
MLYWGQKRLLLLQAEGFAFRAKIGKTFPIDLPSFDAPWSPALGVVWILTGTTMKVGEKEKRKLHNINK